MNTSEVKEKVITEDDGTLSHWGSLLPGSKHVWPAQIGPEVYTQSGATLSY